MRPLKPKAIRTLDDNEHLYVSRGLINSTVAQILSSDSNYFKDDNKLLLVSLFKNAVRNEFNEKKAIPFIKMTAKQVRDCFPDYMNSQLGDFFK